MLMKTCLFCACRSLRMLCLWTFLFLISRTIAQTRNKEDDYRCVIPEKDIVKNGTFFVDTWLGSTWEGKEQPPAGTKFLTYELEFQCDPGFYLRGNQYVRCVSLEIPEFPECTDTCEASDPNCPLQSDGIASNLDGLTGSDECGTVFAAPTALAGGRTAIPGDVPWQAAIYDKTTEPFMQVCGGSIVSKDVVISAAHCFKLPDEFYAVAVGKIYRPYNNPLDIDAHKSDVLEIRIPPRYRGSVTSFQDDIAAVILATPIKFTNTIFPVCLHFGAEFDEVQLTPGTLGRVAGWGIDSQNGRPSQVLNLAEMPMVDVGTCFMLQDVSFIQYITSDKICAGYTNGTSLCKGDSGGGLAVPHRTGYTTKYYLRGVVSTGPPPTTPSECNVNAVTTLTRVAKHEYFIKSAIAKTPLRESELRIPTIIPANFINSNPNRLVNNGVNDGVPLKVDSVQQMGIFNNQNNVFGNSQVPQAGAPGTVVIIPDTQTIDGDQIIQEPLVDDPVKTNSFINEKPITGSFGNSHDPQAAAPGTVVVIPDTLIINGDRNTQDSSKKNPVQATDFINERPIIDSFGNSRDPQAAAPGTVVVIPDTPTINGDRNAQEPPRNNPVQTNTFINERPIIGSFDNIRDPQAAAPGTVVVIPDTQITNGDRNTQESPRDITIQTNSFINERPIGSFGNSRDPQAGAPGTVVIPNTLVIDVNRNTDDPLREDAVQPVGIFDKQRPVIESSQERNVTDNSETLINTVDKSVKRPMKDSFIPKPIAELDNDDKVFTDLNINKPLIDTTRRPTVPSTNNIEVISEGLLTTPSPQLQNGAPDFFNYPHWPHLPNTPYQQQPNQNWLYPSQNLNYPTQNVNYPNQNVHYPTQNVNYPTQNVNYPNQNGQYPSHIKPQNPHNVDNNGYFGHNWQNNNQVWNSQNHPGYYHGYFRRNKK